MDDVKEEVAAIEKPVGDKATFQVFGSVDLNDKGQVKSTYPSWYFDHLRDELKNEIDRMKTQLKFDRIPKSEVAITQDRLAQKEIKLKDIESSTIDLRGKMKDRVSKVYNEIGEKITETMFSRDDMRKGLADAHEEMKRMTEPIIEVRGDLTSFAKACNVKVVKGKVTRDGAAKMWKIAGKALDERTNVEALRKD